MVRFRRFELFNAYLKDGRESPTFRIFYDYVYEYDEWPDQGILAKSGGNIQRRVQ